MMSAARPAPVAVAGGLRYPIPSGWLARDDGAGNVQFFPPDRMPGPDFSVTVVAVETSESPADSRLGAVVDIFFRDPNQPAWQDGLISSMGGFRAVALKGKTQRYAAYAARWENKVQLVFVAAKD